MTPFIHNHARYVVQPDNKRERAKCAGCGEVFYYDDMLSLGVLDYCHDCAAIVAEDNEGLVEE